MCRRPEGLCYRPALLSLALGAFVAKIMKNVLIDFDGTWVHDDDSGVGTPIGVRRVSAVSFALAFW